MSEETSTSMVSSSLWTGDRDCLGAAEASRGPGDLAGDRDLFGGGLPSSGTGVSADFAPSFSSGSGLSSFTRWKVAGASDTFGAK